MTAWTLPETIPAIPEAGTARPRGGIRRAVEPPPADPLLLSLDLLAATAVATMPLWAPWAIDAALRWL